MEGVQNRRGRACKVLLLLKVGAEKSFSHAKGGGGGRGAETQKVSSHFSVVACLAILKGAQLVSTL